MCRAYEIYMKILKAARIEIYDGDDDNDARESLRFVQFKFTSLNAWVDKCWRRQMENENMIILSIVLSFIQRTLADMEQERLRNWYRPGAGMRQNFATQRRYCHSIGVEFHVLLNVNSTRLTLYAKRTNRRRRRRQEINNKLLHNKFNTRNTQISWSLTTERTEHTSLRTYTAIPTAYACVCVLCIRYVAHVRPIDRKKLREISWSELNRKRNYKHNGQQHLETVNSYLRTATRRYA